MKSIPYLRSILAATLLALAHPSALQAASATWNNAVGTDFNTGTNWTGGTGVGGIPGTADNALFDSVTPTFQPDLSAPLTIQGLTFSLVALNGGWTLASANSSLLTLTNVGTTTSSAINAANTSGTNTISAGLVLGGAAATTATVTQARSGTLILSGPISSTNAITGLSFAAAAGAGAGSATFTLSGNNTYSGTTQITTNEVVNINSATAISTGTLIFAGNATIDNTSGTSSLVLSNNNNINLSNGSLTYAGASGNSLSFGSGLITMSGNNRSVTVTAGTLTIASIAADTAARTFTKQGAGTLVITGAADSSFQGGFILNGSGGVLLIGNKAALGTGNFTSTTGVLQASTDLSGANKIANTTTLTVLTVSGSNNIEFGGKLTGNTGGSRTLTSSIAGGLLTLNNVDISNDVSVARTLTIAGTGNTTVNGVIANGTGTTTANGLTITNTGITTLNGNNTYTGATTITTAGNNVIMSGNSTGGGGVTLNNATASLAIGSDSTPSTVGSTVTSGPLGSGTLTLGSGTLSASGGARTIANPITFLNANNYTIGGSNDLTLNGAVQWGGTQTLTVNNVGTTTFGGVFTLRTDATATSTAVRTFTLAGSGTTIMNGAIVNGSTLNGVVVLNGTGTTTLGGNNSYSGNTTIASGNTVKLGNANGLGFGGSSVVNGTTTLTAGGTLDLNGQNAINEPLTINGTGVGGNGALINSNTSTTAVIGSGVATLVVASAGSGLSAPPTVTVVNGGGATATATLGVSTASFAITGGTTVYTTAPTVTISGGGGLSATATAVLSAGTSGTVTGINVTNVGNGYSTAPSIAFSGGVVGTAGTDPTGTGNATNFSVGALQLTSAGTGAASPTVTFDSGTATATANATSVVLGSTVDNSIGGPGNIAINSPVTGGATNPLTKVGTGAVVLAGINTYAGATTVSDGKLVVTGSLNGLGAVAVNGGTLGGSGSIAGVTTVGSGAKIHPGVSSGAVPTTLTINNNVTFNTGSIFKISIDSAGNTTDRLTIGGTTHGLTLTGTDTLTFALVNGGALSNLAPGTYTIASFTGSLTGTFTTDGTLQAGWSILYPGDVGGIANQINLVVVPEPSTYAMIIGGIGMLALFRRRRMR